MQNRILDAAHDLIREQGPGALSIRVIADRVGVSPMTLYTYFPNRAELMEALRQRQRIRSISWEGAQVERARSGDVLGAIRVTLERYAEFAHNNPFMYRFLWVIPTSECRHAEHHISKRRHDLDHLARLIRIGIEQGILPDRDATITAATVVYIVNAPHIIYHSGRMTDTKLHDAVSQECMKAAMDYLHGPTST